MTGKVALDIVRAMSSLDCGRDHSLYTGPGFERNITTFSNGAYGKKDRVSADDFLTRDPRTGIQKMTGNTLDGDCNTSSFTVPLRGPEPLANMLSKRIGVLVYP